MVDEIYLRQAISILRSVNAVLTKKGNLDGAKCRSLIAIWSPADADCPDTTNLKDHLKRQFVIIDMIMLLEFCKALVTSFKRKHLMGRLTKSIKQCIETSWNSALGMMESISDVFDEVIIFFTFYFSNTSTFFSALDERF